jgi:hypothetical protein
MYLYYFNEKKPRVSRHTARFTGRYVPVPGTGTVYAGAGTVWENPTRGLPVLNPTSNLDMNFPGISSGVTARSE